MQTADLFHNLHLHWPESWKWFIEQVASVFNFAIPHWLSFVDPQCSFELTYLQKWSLMMGSPFIIMATMAVYVMWKLAMRRFATNTLRHSPWLRDAVQQLKRDGETEMHAHESFRVGMSVEIYSSSSGGWVAARVEELRTDADGETTVEVSYWSDGQKRGRRVDASDRSCIRPLADNAVHDLQLEPELEPEPESCIRPLADNPEPEPEPELEPDATMAQRLLQSRPASPNLTRHSEKQNPTYDEANSSHLSDHDDNPHSRDSATPGYTQTSANSGCCKALCRCEQIWCGPKWWIKELQTSAEFDLLKTMRKLQTILLGLLMVGYVMLVQYALAPLGCQDLYGKSFMTTHASIEVRRLFSVRIRVSLPNLVDFLRSATGVRQAVLSSRCGLV